MGISVTLIGDPGATFDKMAKAIDNLPHQMEIAFLEWQREDMNRRRPSLSGGGGGSNMVETIIRNRGSVSRHHARAKPKRRRVGPRRGGKSPILRPELLTKLQERMASLLKETPQQWR